LKEKKNRGPSRLGLYCLHRTGWKEKKNWEKEGRAPGTKFVPPRQRERKKNFLKKGGGGGDIFFVISFFLIPVLLDSKKGGGRVLCQTFSSPFAGGKRRRGDGFNLPSTTKKEKGENRRGKVEQS